jgi:serine/threonine protein kinase
MSGEYRREGVLNIEPKPADLLEGLTLEGGWVVTQRLERDPGATGGSFSSAYFVERHVEGMPFEMAFLKALDLSAAFNMPMGVVDALQYLTNAFIHERDLVMKCAAERLGSVVVGIEAGEVIVSDPSVNPLLKSVPYLIFERADGDVRKIMNDRLVGIDDAWAFRVLHGVANGLRQLHQTGISHQDVKPSNVMSYGKESRVGDLGRACLRDRTGFYDAMPIAGDPLYAPPEYLYGKIPSDYWIGRKAVDAFQLGSLLVFLLGGAGMTSLIQEELDDAFHWSTWPYPYENVLPYVRNAFDVAVESLVNSLSDNISVASEVESIVRELCDPDPSLRGFPSRGSRSHQFSMERYVSQFDRIALKAEIALTRRDAR